MVQIGDDRIILLIQLSAMTRELDVLCCDQSSMIRGLPSHRFPVGTQGRFSRVFCGVQPLDAVPRE